MSVTVTIEGECVTECCGEPVEFCNCEIRSSQITLAGGDEYAWYLDYTGAEVESISNEPVTCDENGFGNCTPEEGYPGGTKSECLLAALNGTYGGAELVSDGFGGYFASHYLGEENNPDDPGEVIGRRTIWRWGCCRENPPASEPPNPCISETTLWLTAIREECCWKITYRLTCEPCGETGTRWRAGDVTTHNQTITKSWTSQICYGLVYSGLIACASDGPVMGEADITDCGFTLAGFGGQFNLHDGPVWGFGDTDQVNWDGVIFCGYDWDLEYLEAHDMDPAIDCCHMPVNGFTFCPYTCYEDCTSQPPEIGKTITECNSEECGGEEWENAYGCNRTAHLTATVAVT